jgi:hypothetical protein
LRTGKAGGNVDQCAAQCCPAGFAVAGAGEDRGGAQQVVSNGGAQHPGGVGAEPTFSYLELMACARL